MVNLFIKHQNVNDTMGIMLIRLSTSDGKLQVCRKIFFEFYGTAIFLKLFRFLLKGLAIDYHVMSRFEEQ